VATAAAVAAPIPLLAPVTTASRPASHLAEEAGGLFRGKRSSGSLTSHSPVETFVCVEAQLHVKVLLGVLAAGRPRDLGQL
jgi:hypothetical protein